MLALLLLYFIGKKFYDLAGTYNKQQWKFSILSIIVYYGSIVIIQVLVGIIFYILIPSSFDYNGNAKGKDELIISLLSIPLALLIVYFLYRYLENKWKKEEIQRRPNIEDIGKSNF